MNTLIIEYDTKCNNLDFAKSKLSYLSIFKFEDVEIEIFELTEQVEDLKKRLKKVNLIDVPKELMMRQLDEYIEQLEKPYYHPFSLSQGMIFFHMFYIKPLIYVKNILFNDLRGISGVQLNLTLEENDAVMDTKEFVVLLKKVKSEIFLSQNYYDLYSAYQNFSVTVKKDFCENVKKRR